MNMDWGLFRPEFILAALAMSVLGLDLVMPAEKKHWLAYLSVAGVMAAIVSALSLGSTTASLFGGLFLVDGYATFFKVFLLVTTVVMLLASVDYVKKTLTHPGEFYGILMLSVLAMMVMVSAGELLTAYIALELFSFSLYILAGFNLRDIKSNEAGIKYILVGAFSTALMLYGISLVYGTLQTTTFTGMSAALAAATTFQPAFLAGLVLVVVGFGFKVTAVPFHMWAPDVYEGAPTPVTGYLSVASKAVSFALLLRLMATGFAPAVAEWRGVIAGLGVISIVVGNLVAIAQTNIKRMLAYSSIGQAGYLLLGVAAFTPLAANGILFHLVAYSATNFAVFACVIAYENMTGKVDIADYAGLYRNHPFMALVMSAGLFSLAGLPIFAGFTSKFFLFTAVGQAGILWGVVVAAVGSLVSLYYYLMVIKTMYLGDDAPAAHAEVHSEEHPALPHGDEQAAHGAHPIPVVSGASEPHALRLGQPMGIVLTALLVAVIALGVYPSPLIDLIQNATLALPFK